MLESLTLTAFKAYGEETTIPFRPFTMLAGPNGAGKSTILQAIDLLGGITRGTLAEYLRTRGWAATDLGYGGGGKCRLVAHVRLDEELFTWSVTIGRSRPEVLEERVVGGGVTIFERSRRRMWRLDEVTQSKESIVQTLGGSWLAAFDPENRDDRRRYPSLSRLAGWAQRIRGYFYIDPQILRRPGRRGQTELGPHGEDLAPFLAHLRATTPKTYRALVERLQQRYPALESLRPVQEPDGLVHLNVKERWNGAAHTFDASQVSDGLLRLVAAAAIREIKPPVSTLLFDEIENGMHPALLGALTELLQDVSPGSQAIVTTHSPIAMNYVRDEQGILIVDRDKAGRPHATPLPKAKGYARLRGAFDPGELWYNLGEDKLVR
ncbi:MAG TPA: AAA family ATPase [Kofleriaceae bacterium]|jgi:predicted ATPase